MFGILGMIISATILLVIRTLLLIREMVAGQEVLLYILKIVQ